jgi:hypothetical protein
VHIDGFADAFKPEGDENADRDDDDVDEEVFEGAGRAFGGREFPSEVLDWVGYRILLEWVIRG